MKIAFQGCVRYPTQPLSTIWLCEEAYLRALARIDSRNEYLLFNHALKNPSGLARGMANPGAPNFSVYVPRFSHRLNQWSERWLGVDLKASLLRRRGVDLLHVYEHIYPAPSRFPTVVTFHNLYAELRPDWSSPEILERMRANARRATHLIAAGEAVKRDLLRFYSVAEDRITVIPYGINHDLFSRLAPERLEAVRKRLGLPQRFLLCVGPVSPRKNLGCALDGYLRLSRTHPDLGLVLTGGRTPWRDELEAKVRRAGAARVVFPGEVSNEDLAALYNLAAVFVYPSAWFGVPVMEAIACGCPVAAAKNDWTLEVIEDAAVYFEPDSAEELGDRIDALLRDEGRRRAMVGRGLAVAARYTWEDAARRTLELYERLVRAGSAVCAS